jgi:hypothetical protein
MIVTGAPTDPLTMLGVTVSSIGAWARDALGASNSSRSAVTNRHLSDTRGERWADDSARVTGRECGIGARPRARPPR